MRHRALFNLSRGLTRGVWPEIKFYVPMLPFSPEVSQLEACNPVFPQEKCLLYKPDHVVLFNLYKKFGFYNSVVIFGSSKWYYIESSLHNFFDWMSLSHYTWYINGRLNWYCNHTTLESPKHLVAILCRPLLGNLTYRNATKQNEMLLENI